MRVVWSMLLAVLVTLAGSVSAAPGQQPVPQPFPRPGERPPVRPPAAEAPLPAEEPDEDDADDENGFEEPIAITVPRPPPLPATAGASQAAEEVPTEAALGLPIYPTARFITSYDAGAGQRFYLFGTSASYSDMVTYYRTLLRQRGSQVFGAPPTHVFEVGRFRQDVMAFPPGVTIKDYTWGAFEGYLDPRPDADPARHQTIIQIVPPPLEDR